LGREFLFAKSKRRKLVENVSRARSRAPLDVSSHASVDRYHVGGGVPFLSRVPHKWLLYPVGWIFVGVELLPMFAPTRWVGESFVTSKVITGESYALAGMGSEREIQIYVGKIY